MNRIERQICPSCRLPLPTHFRRLRPLFTPQVPTVCYFLQLSTRGGRWLNRFRTAAFAKELLPGRVVLRGAVSLRLMSALVSWVDADGDITMPELAPRLLAERGVRAHPASLSRLLIRHGFTVKKTLLASETDRADIVRRRRIWTVHRQPWMKKRPQRLVFIDETGTTTKMTRIRGRARKGQRLKMKAPFGHWGHPDLHRRAAP